MGIRRWFLMLKVMVFRAFMALGMKFHHRADPKSPKPNFKIIIPSRLSVMTGQFKLLFYVPEGYFQAPEGHKYPVVVNFHGGGFTLGTGADDARWAFSVVKHVNAVFVSVEYRLAPEFPFSVAWDDGSDAIIYLASHAKELQLDPHRIATSGFSAGGNLAFAVPLMLWDLKNNMGKRHLGGTKYPQELHRQTTRSKEVLSSTKSAYTFTDFKATELEINQKFPDLTIRCIVSFYPPIDFRQARAEKRHTNRKPEKNLPAFLTNLFDESFMYPRDKIDVADPYLSPAAASDELLKAAYPHDIVLYTCEYDMLNAEGVAFKERLASDQVGKKVYGGVIKEVAHAFDKMPNPSKYFKTTDKCYMEACAQLKRVFDDRLGEKDIDLVDNHSATVHPPENNFALDKMKDE